MILGLEFTVLVYLMLAAAFRLAFAWSQKAALWGLALSGAALLAATNVWLFTYLAGQIVLVLILHAAGRRFPARARQISWVAFLGLVPFNLRLWFGEGADWLPQVENASQTGFVTLAFTAGATFFVIKSFVSLREAIQEGRFRFVEMLAGLTFLPAFPAGPIFGTHPFRAERIAPKVTFADIRLAILQFGWGAAAFYVLSPALRAEAADNAPGFWGGVGDMYMGLLALFFDFSGYTLMAIAMAALFGVTLPQNFNRPYLATTIREFWQRWHMSLSWFVGTYLFKPFVRSTGSQRTGIFLAFTLVGLWHEFTLGYFLWGIGHGAALSLAMKPPALWRRVIGALPVPVGKAIAWALTMTWVAALSYTATHLSEMIP